MTPISSPFDSTSERLDAIVRAAAARLDGIVSDERFQALRRGNGAAFDFVASRRAADVSFVVKFGAATLSLAEAAALDLDSIVPLTDAENGSVQIWANGRLCGRGSLLTSRGKLVVKIESFDPDAAFE